MTAPSQPQAPGSKAPTPQSVKPQGPAPRSLVDMAFEAYQKHAQAKARVTATDGELRSWLKRLNETEAGQYKARVEQAEKAAASK